MKKGLFTKAAAIALSATLTVTTLVGCGNKKTATTDDQGRTIISVGGWPAQEGKTLDTYNAKKERFEKENPDVVIQPDNWMFDLKSFYPKAAGGQLPTIFQSNFTEVSQIIDANYGADLTDCLKKRGYDGMFNEKVLDVLSRNGKIYSFPTSTYVLGLAYNTEMFQAAGLMEADGTPKQPKDWYEVAEFAQKIKAATGKAGIVFPTSNNNGGWIFTPVAWSFGVEFMKKGDDGKWKATFNSPEAAAALQYIKDLKWKYDVLPTNTLIDSDEYSKLFATGNAGMQINAGDVPRKVVSYGMTPDQLGIMAMPAGPKKHITLLGGYCSNVRSDATAEQIDAAVRWIETTNTYKATEEFKINTINTLESNLEKGMLIGIKSMSVWSQDAESLKLEHQLIDERANSNLNHVRLYNEFVANCPAEIKAEEPVCAQELYAILDNCIQEVLTNKDADCAAVLEKANSDFQNNYLDNTDY